MLASGVKRARLGQDGGVSAAARASGPRCARLGRSARVSPETRAFHQERRRLRRNEGYPRLPISRSSVFWTVSSILYPSIFSALIHSVGNPCPWDALNDASSSLIRASVAGSLVHLRNAPSSSPSEVA